MFVIPTGCERVCLDRNPGRFENEIHVVASTPVDSEHLCWDPSPPRCITPLFL
ncbi:hypothetical protein AArcCO_1620 [Halalkaliarchaeum sp. AArc-CO]|nr:hypothetical protein AArcCO_1620 [Halalkaliarchaeum sp. AArc-CO]